MSELPIVPFLRERHEPALFTFLGKVFSAEATERRRAVMTWLYDEMPGRDRFPVRYVIMDGEKIAGSMGHLPADFIVKGQRVPVRFTHDLLVDPAYRGLGLAKRIVENALVAGEFIPGGLWMTNPCYKIHLAGGFDDMKPLVTQTLVLDPDTFTARKDLGGIKGGVSRVALRMVRERALKRARAETTGERTASRVRAIDTFDPALDGVWRGMLDSYGITRMRDAEYLNWRYVRHPNLDYHILLAERDGVAVGYIAWRLPPPSDPERRAVITDFLVRNGDADAFRLLVSQVIVEASGAGVEVLSLLTTQPWAVKVLRALGFAPRSQTQSWVVGGWRDRIPQSWLTDHAHWHICSADSDGDIWTGSH
jgi:GNAT superfamily N-acetyltransferase